MITPIEIIRDVEDYFNLPRHSIIKRSRTKLRAEARKAAIFLARTHTDHSWEELAEHFNRDFSSVAENFRNINIKKRSDTYLKCVALLKMKYKENYNEFSG